MAARARAKAPADAHIEQARATRDEGQITIPAPNLRVVQFELEGTAPYVQHRFANKLAIMQTQREGSTARKQKKRDPKDFAALYESAKHTSSCGTYVGIPAASFRAAMISACRLVGFQMTRAKLSVFVIADGLDIDGSPIVRIEGEPEMHTSHVRNETGVIDIRARPMWREWKCRLHVRYDADQFTATDVANLMLRAGIQVGIGEGRPDSKKSLTGMGWGTWRLVIEQEGDGDAQQGIARRAGAAALTG